MKKDPHEVMIDALGELLQKASKSQERAARVRFLLWTILLVSVALGYIYFS